MQSIIAAATLATLQAPLMIAQAPAMPAVAQGVVTDARTGETISGAFIQQEGSVFSIFTNAEGSFRLLLDKTGKAGLQVSHVGYETATVPVGDGRELKVALKPISGFAPMSPAFSLPRAGSLAAADTTPLNTGAIFAYRLRRQSISAGGADLTGFANNDYRMGMRYRYHRWLLEGEGSHFETPIDVAGLSRDENPAFTPSTWQAGARLGYVLPFNKELESATSIAYRWRNTVPNNKDIPYLGGNAVDFEQTRHALGGVFTTAWRPGRGPWHFEGSLGVYPMVLARAKDPGTTFADSFLTDVHAVAGYEIVTGMRLGLGYQWERWSGRGSDDSQLLSLQLHYTPGGIPQENE